MSNSTSTASLSLKAWPEPMIESNGDYRNETYIETCIGGPLYAAQSSLPRLPAPSISQTIARFLPTALPFAKTAEEIRSLEDACARFPEEAKVLQERLEARRENEENRQSSWLQLWWNTEGYLKVRKPLVVNVSCFFHLADDGTLPLPAFEEDDNASMGVKRGAAILYATAEFRKLVCSGGLPHELIGRKDPKTPLCSTSFKYMFNSCRVPRRSADTYKMYDPNLHQHCVVARKGIFFSVDFMNEEGGPLPIEVLEERLRLCVQEAGEDGSKTMDLGLLTSNDRESMRTGWYRFMRTFERK